MLQIASLKDLDILLKGNLLYANGKNFRVDHLHATAAQSQHDYENLYGIYLALPKFAWMAVWMAVTNRALLKKRQLNYFCPNEQKKDHVGHLGIFAEGREIPPAILVEQAYLYLFEIEESENLRIVDVSWCDGKRRMTILSGLGFDPQEIELPGRRVVAWKTDHAAPMLLKLDAWQAVLVNVPRLEPTVEVELMPSLIRELCGRVSRIPHDPSQNYISPPLAG